MKCPQCNVDLVSATRHKVQVHCYWLTEDEDIRVLELMKHEEQGLSRKLAAENRWAATLKRMRSGSLLDRIRRALY